MSTTNAVNKQSQPHGPAQALTTILNAIDSVLPPPQTINVGGTSYTNTTLKAVVQNLLAPYTAVTGLKAQLAQAYLTRDGLEAQVKQFLDTFLLAAGNQFGVGSSNYVKLGLKVKKKAAPLTAEQLTVKHQKTLATRTARGTLGSQQKKAVKGTVAFPLTLDASGQVATPQPAPVASPALLSSPVPAAQATPQNGSTPAAPPGPVKVT